MSENNILCPPPATRQEKSFEYQQYYLGEKDEVNRKCGEGQNHWSGAQSLESYTGHFIRDTMHGFGDYRLRHQGPENNSITYEGHFYCNMMHGYGTMSYPDGRTFCGLFFNNVRWGPGVQSHANVHEDVGFWRGDQLVRLAWRPEGPSIAPEFMNSYAGRTIVETHRIMLTSDVEIIGETNKALELLKQCGADPRVAAEKWTKVYPRYCTDLASPLCYTESFDQDYYKGKIYTLKQVDVIPKKNDQFSEDTLDDVVTYFAWNNNDMTINMMKHCYKHEKQRCNTRLDLKPILSGPRRQFKSAGNYEIDCRTLLMAACLDHIEDVAQLVNERNVYPDVSDVLGNSAVMYATVGEQPDVIHFLVEAGANVDSYNDCCCTPLGVALMRYVCAENDVPPAGMPQALIPPPLAPPAEPIANEWNITREQLSYTTGMLMKSPSKSARNMSSKKIKSLLSVKDQPGSKKKADTGQNKVFDPIFESDESISEDKTLYNNINLEYSITITDIYTFSNEAVQYIFYVTDMIKEAEMDIIEDDQTKTLEKSLKKLLSSKTIKDTRKTSQDTLWQHPDKEDNSISSAQKIKSNKLAKTMCTILQLLSDGANSKLVSCPQPALLMAVMSNSPDLVRQLVRYGANINEKYHEVYDYTPLDVAVSRVLTADNLEMVRAVLDCGADAEHRLVYNIDYEDPNVEYFDGPTLLHAVLAKKTENEIEEDVRHNLLELLLEYNCSPTKLFKGHAALDIAMSKSNDIASVFIKNPKTDLNAIINNCNQNILVKMFSFPYFRSNSSTERLQLLTDLLLYGADPLLECQNRENTYQNIFVFTKQTFEEMDSSIPKPATLPGTKISDTKVGKKADKSKKEDKSSTKNTNKSADDIEDYRQAIDLVTDCARLIYIRWLQSRLMKELIVTIDKYKHRHWHMILKSCQGTRSTGLWLSPQRCLEIWDILSSSKKGIYNNPRNLKHLLSIVIFLSWQNYGKLNSDVPPNTTLTTSIKNAIDFDVNRLLHKHKADKIKSAMLQWKLTYVKPELVNDSKKFNVCFECILPLNDEKVLCSWCKQVSFCSYECMKSNVHRSSCHPCSDNLKMKYFLNSDESFHHCVS